MRIPCRDPEPISILLLFFASSGTSSCSTTATAEWGEVPEEFGEGARNTGRSIDLFTNQNTPITPTDKYKHAHVIMLH